MPLRAEKKALESWLRGFTFSKHVTLASNNPLLSTGRARDLLRAWDAWQNSKIAGARWQKQPAKRMFCFYFLEKPERNPHWHCLVQLQDLDPNILHRKTKMLDHYAHRHWHKLIPSGSVHITPVNSQEIARAYVVKGLLKPKSFKEFVLPEQFL